MNSLIDEVKEGNKESYAKMISDVKDELNNIAKSKIKNQEDINDILQNTFIIGYLKINQLKNEKYFKTWLIRILINECNKYYRENEKYVNLTKKCSDYFETKTDLNEPEDIGFENLIRDLDIIEKNIFRMYYQENFSIKVISKKLNIKENTVKTKMHRGKKKVYETYKKIVLFVVLIGILTTGVTFGRDIISYLKNIFSLSSVGQNNEGVTSAIENKQWFQNIEMTEICLNEKYSINVKYLIVDEINIYVLFELKNNVDEFMKNARISITDLILTDENGNLVYNVGVADEQLYGKISGWKRIENNKNDEILELLYIFSDGFSNMKTLKFDFSQVVIYNDKDPSQKETITMEHKNIDIELSEKFTNKNKRNVKLEIEKNDDNIDIRRVVITETGLYAIVKTNNHNLKLKLKSEKSSKMCEKQLLDVEPENNEFTFLIYAVINEQEKIYRLKNNNTLIKLEIEKN